MDFANSNYDSIIDEFKEIFICPKYIQKGIHGNAEYQTRVEVVDGLLACRTTMSEYFPVK